MPQKSKRRKHEENVQQVVDTAARVIQGLAIVALVAVLVVDSITPEPSTPVWVIGGLLGVAIGLSPKQILELIGNIAKNLTGAKK